MCISGPAAPARSPRCPDAAQGWLSPALTSFHPDDTLTTPPPHSARELIFGKARVTTAGEWLPQVTAVTPTLFLLRNTARKIAKKMAQPPLLTHLETVAVAYVVC